MLSLKPGAEDVLQERPLIVGLSRNPDQSGKAKHSILAQSNIGDGNAHFPVQVNDKPALWFMDTGASISVMSDAEAAAMGLEVHSVESEMADITGRMISFKITEVGKLTIGKTHLKHVAFIVLPYNQPPFDDIPTEQQALLGIQVLRALRSVHISKMQQVEIGGSEKDGASSSPLAFDQAQPITPMDFEGKDLNFTLDTGAEHTTLNPHFATAFPETIAHGEKKDHTLTGVGGSLAVRSVVIERLTFTLARKPVVLSPANVLLQKTTDTSGWAAGNLGWDLIRQTEPFTIDFCKMRLFVR